MKHLIFLMIYLNFLSNADEECNRNFSIRKNAIILTKSSKAKGAIFIHKQVISRFADCYALCCSNRDCTVAVYENKVNHKCYLFNCKQPNVCSFTEHSHYISMMYVQPESKVNVITHDKNEKAKNNVLKPSVDGKLGEICGSLRKCGPENSMCTSGTCICQIGFIGRNGECVRSLCPKPELMFQCFDVSKMPFCIALYDQCNGLYECGDGSDELNCEDKSSGTRNNTVIRHNDDQSKQKDPHQAVYGNSVISVDHHKIQENSDDHQIVDKNVSHSLPEFQDLKHLKPTSPRRINPLAENQLLVLKSKNKLPKYSNNNNNEKNNRQYAKPQRDTDSNNQIYDNRNYGKIKTSSYPHLTKIDDYYQKSGPDSSENRNQMKNSDTYLPDYDFSQSNINNRDSNSEWYGDKNSNPYSDSIYQDSPRKYSNDRNGYVDYSEPEDEVYSKSRNPLIDNDYYNLNYYDRNPFEKSMYRSSQRKNEPEVHKFLIKPKPQSNLNENHPTPTSKRQIKEDLDDTDRRSSKEWSTAVIILSLGLLITATLLIAIGLKMRSWRHRLRKGKKGKSLTTDEGDYLINGMYL